MNDTDAQPHAILAPGKCPAITARRDGAADYQHHFVLIEVRRVEIVFGSDPESLMPANHTGLLE